MFKNISNMTKFYCPNKSIYYFFTLKQNISSWRLYYFFKINTKISTSFRRSMLISFWIDVPGADPEGRAHPARTPTLKLDFSHEIPQKFSRLPPLDAFFFNSAPLTWNPRSAPDINLNMYIINVIADDETKIGLYEIYCLND